MKRICKSHRIITSQIIGVKWWWEKNCFFFPFKSHERDSIIRMLSAAARKPLWNPTRKMGPAENLTVPCAGLVNTKNILSKAAISFSYNWGYLWENLAPLMVKWSGSGLVHKDKHYVKKLALDADIRSTLVKLIGTAVFGCTPEIKQVSCLV